MAQSDLLFVESSVLYQSVQLLFVDGNHQEHHKWNVEADIGHHNEKKTGTPLLINVNEFRELYIESVHMCTSYTINTELNFVRIDFPFS